MDPYDISTVANLSCNAGYSLVGEAVRTCVEGAGAEGEWSNGPSNCDREFLNRLLVHVCLHAYVLRDVKARLWVLKCSFGFSVTMATAFFILDPLK